MIVQPSDFLGHMSMLLAVLAGMMFIALIIGGNRD